MKNTSSAAAVASVVRQQCRNDVAARCSRPSTDMMASRAMNGFVLDLCEMVANEGRQRSRRTRAQRHMMMTKHDYYSSDDGKEGKHGDNGSCKYVSDCIIHSFIEP